LKYYFLLPLLCLAFSGSSVEIEPSISHEYAMDTIIVDESSFRICYSDFPEGLPFQTPDAKREVGIIGLLDKQNIFYELWTIPNSNYLTIKYLFLRTDTIHIDNFDFCFPELGEEQSPDSAICKKLVDNVWKTDPTLTIDKIPTFIQPLIMALNGWEALSGLNGKDKDSPKIYIQNRNLLLQYHDYDNAENSWQIRRTYSYDGHLFKLTSIDTVKAKR